MAVSFVAVIITVSANQCQVFLWIVRIKDLVCVDLYFALSASKEYNIYVIHKRFETMFITY